MKFTFFSLVLGFSFLSLAQPTASFAISDNVICEGDCIYIENNSSNDVVSSSWSFPSGTPSFYSGMNPGQVCFAAAGTYTLLLTVTDASGATSTASQQITVQLGFEFGKGFSINGTGSIHHQDNRTESIGMKRRQHKLLREPSFVRMDPRVVIFPGFGEIVP